LEQGQTTRALSADRRLQPLPNGLIARQ